MVIYEVRSKPVHEVCSFFTFDSKPQSLRVKLLNKCLTVQENNPCSVIARLIKDTIENG